MRCSPVAIAADSTPEDWRRQLPDIARRRLRLWAWTIAAMTLAILVVGGVTRLTRSGLSIVEWQPILGAVPPIGEAQWQERFEQYQRFPEYRKVRQGMTLAEFKVIYFWEYLHRLIARLIGVVFVVPLAIFWRVGYLRAPIVRRALAILALGAAQAVMGWLMVRSGLVDRPSVSHYRLAAHLSLALVIFGLSIWLARDLAPARTTAVHARLRRLMMRGLAVVGTLAGAQIVCGAFVAGLKAGLMYNTFPLMADRFVPPGMFSFDSLLLNFVQNAAAVQWVHRLLGTALLVAALVFFNRVRGAAPDRTSRGLNHALLALVAAQYLLGVVTLLFRVPVGLGVLHQAGAAAIVGVWVAWVHHVRNLTA